MQCLNSLLVELNQELKIAQTSLYDKAVRLHGSLACGSIGDSCGFPISDVFKFHNKWQHGKHFLSIINQTSLGFCSIK